MSDLHIAYRRLLRRQDAVWILAALVVVVAELGFDVIERGIGRYLVWQNSGRQRIGRSWEAAQSRAVAGTRLEQAQQEIRQRLGTQATVEN